MLEAAKAGLPVDPTEYQQLTQGDQQDSSDSTDQDFSRRSKKMKTSYPA